MSDVDFRKVAFSSLGALALSATCVLGAVGPARANAPLTTADWVQQVERKITAIDAGATAVPAGRVAEAVVAVRFDAEGDFAGASIARSTGNAALDRRAVQVAQGVAYPALPAGYRGRAQTVAMRLAFGGEDEVARHAAQAARGRVDVETASAAAAWVAAK